ncbi:hypothetical protein E8E14_010142 [Neopestalotiopsis sp. 37M]|nr:hypothetical protein E8E14_010142 [Neopestalotiopsis sp. 37M]
MELAEWTSTHLEELLAGLPNVPGKSINRDNQRYIFQQDPAYAQMFCGYDNRIAAVKDIYDRVISKGKGPPDMREEGGPGALRFICNAENRVLGDDQSTPLCGTGEGATQAQALIPYKPADGLLVEPKYAFEQSSSITFCPKFFTDFPNIDGVVGSGEYTLDKVDCLERILLHEYMHLPWVGDMPGDPDKIGYYNAADFAKKNTWGAISIHAENLFVKPLSFPSKPSLMCPTCFTVHGLHYTRISTVKAARLIHGRQE